MAGELSIRSAVPDPRLLDLPWREPLELWPDSTIAVLPKGISRHLVRFVRGDGDVLAVKETTRELAESEYEMLRNLQRLALPAVEPIAVVTGRHDLDGEELAPVLITRHLRFSLPYRAVYSQSLRPETAIRLIDALAVLLVRLHIQGFFWGDVSLSNTLFRRDAGAFAAYLVDAETGRLYDDGLSDGQRANDLEIARVNVAGELLDLQAGGRLDEGVDPVAVAESIVATYRALWAELTGSESIPETERWRINERVERLNDLGFDIEELAIRTGDDGARLLIQPKVVDAGHHSRRLLRLTGIDAEENQARRLLNDLDEFRVTTGAGDERDDEEQAAHDWVTTVFEPVIRAIPRDLRGKLEPAEVFHQLLDHRWYLSQNDRRNVPLAEALASYVEKVLRHRRDEITVVAPVTETLSIPLSTGELRAIEPDDEDWRARV